MVDRAGRIVLPKPVREQLNLHPGAEMDCRVENRQVILRPHVMETPLVRKGRLLVHQGQPEGDLLGAEKRDRKARLATLADLA